MGAIRLSPGEKRAIEALQRGEATEAAIYARLARLQGNRANAAVLRRIAVDEARHYRFLSRITGREIAPSRWGTWKHFWISRIFGLTFGLKRMENGEEMAQTAYLRLARRLARRLPRLGKFRADENRHERALIGILKERLLDHVGSIVLGLNDALVEFTGALAGFTFALGSTRVVALAGAITGVAAALSMASAEYMSQRSEGEAAKALRAAVYTGIAYIVTVALLVAPYALLSNGPLCLAIVILTALAVIFVFNYYLSVARDLPFWKRFLEMAAISLSVALVSFLIGLVLREVFGISA